MKEGTAAEARIEIYTKNWCSFCDRARALLQAKRVAYAEIDVTRDRDRELEMIERSGRLTVPQIFIGGRSIGGCDDILTLDARGLLDDLLNRAERDRAERLSGAED